MSLQLAFPPPPKQRGAALVVTLLFLVMALMLGFSTSQSSRLEEAMAGNSRALAQSRMAAEYGMSLHWREAINAGGQVGEEYTLSGSESDGFLSISGGESALQGVAYKFEYQVLSNSSLPGLPGGTPTGVYRMTSTGVLVSEGGVSSEVVLEGLGYSYGSGFLGLSPITSASNICQFEPGQGNKFTIEGELKEDGTRNPAISVPDQEDEDYINDKIAQQDDTEKYEGYGGVASPLSESLLNDPDRFHEFIERIKGDANTFPSPGKLDYGRNSPLGTLDDPVVAYVNGDVTGNQGNFYGAGVLLIDGDVEFNGTPSFSGLIIVLGDYKVSGGGGGPIEGSVLVAPYSQGEDGVREFDCANIDFGGGGNASYRYNPETLGVAFEELGSAADYWESENVSSSKPPSIYLHRWNEKIEN